MTDEGETVLYLHKRPQHPLPEVRRTIKGCIYDTTTASVLFHARCDDLSPEPLHGDYWGDVLLINRWGAYFALTYNWNCEPWEDDYERITPLSRVEAIDWAEKHCPYTVEELFGRLPEVGEAEPYSEMPPVPAA